METLSAVLLLAAVVVGVVLLVRLLSAPIRKIFKLLINALCGIVLLYIVNFLGAGFGLQLSMNLINILVAGFLGVPGIILLVLIKLFVL